jgi:FAD/FMN-containing dehydrogenase
MASRSTHASLEHAPAIDDSALGSLQAEFRGELIRPGDDGYEAARQVWNGSVDRRPALVARCSGTADVVAALRFAGAHGLEVAVRGGGHSVAGHGTVEGGLVIDLSPMRGVRVDPGSRRAWVQGGAVLGQLDHETALHGLVTTAGTVSHTGVGGLTLGGGYGLLARNRGLACDNLVSAEVVTAAGEVVTASDETNTDLFWGLRGGGGNFGIVTGFEFRLHPAHPEVGTGDLLYDVDDGPAAMRAFRDFAAEMPETMTITAGSLSVRPEWGIQERAVGTPMVVISWAYLGPQDEGRRIAEPLYAGPKPAVATEQGMTYRGIQSAADAGQRHGIRRYYKGSFVTTLTDAAIDAFVTRGGEPGQALLWGGELISLGGAIGRIAEDATAYSGRDAAFDFLSLANWEDPAEDEERLVGARHYWDTMAPHLSERAYVNSLEADAADRVRAAYGPDKYERLVALKRAYDPGNVFHLNQNVHP